MEIIFATNNKGKLIEIKEIFKDTQYKIIGLIEAGFEVEIEETGETFEENAKIKSDFICNLSNKIVLSDDSGLEIDFLDKKPGVYSARFLGENTPYEIKNQQVLEMLNDVPFEKRTARFVSVISASFPDGRHFFTRGVVEGYINDKPLGDGGFGYDPIFFIPNLNKTSAQLSLAEKNKISHRGIALKEMKEILLKEVQK